MGKGMCFIPGRKAISFFDSQVDLDHQKGQEPWEVTSVLGGKLGSERAQGSKTAFLLHTHIHTQTHV